LDALTPADRAEYEAILAELRALEPELPEPKPDPHPGRAAVEKIKAILRHPRGFELWVRLVAVTSRSVARSEQPGAAEAEVRHESAPPDAGGPEPEPETPPTPQPPAFPNPLAVHIEPTPRPWRGVGALRHGAERLPDWPVWRDPFPPGWYGLG
jgi:hypothetical protein